MTAPAQRLDLRVAAPPAPAGLGDLIAVAAERLGRETQHGIVHPAGIHELRALIASRYRAEGVRTDPEQIVVTAGAQHALHLLFSTLAGPGARVTIEKPSYPHALTALRGLGAQVLQVPVTSEGIDIDHLEAVIRQSAPSLVYLVPDFHNPTGAVLDDEARSRVAWLARRYDVTVISDDTLRETAIDGAPPPRLCHFDGAVQTVVSVGSLSKAFWGGLRVGWIRGPAELIARLARMRVAVDISSPVLEQLIALEVLSRPMMEEEERSLRRARRDALMAAVGRVPGWRASRPAGGLALWVDTGGDRASEVVAHAAAAGLLVAPGVEFGDDDCLEHRVRIAFTHPPEKLSWAGSVLRRVHHALAEQPAAPDVYSVI